MNEATCAGAVDVKEARKPGTFGRGTESPDIAEEANGHLRRLERVKGGGEVIASRDRQAHK